MIADRPMGVPPLEGAAPPRQCEAGRLWRMSHLNAGTLSWFRSCIAVLPWAYVWGLEPGGGAWALPDYAHLEGRLKKTPARVGVSCHGCKCSCARPAPFAVTALHCGVRNSRWCRRA